MNKISWEELWITVAEVRRLQGEHQATRFLADIVELCAFDDAGATLAAAARAITVAAPRS